MIESEEWSVVGSLRNVISDGLFKILPYRSRAHVMIFALFDVFNAQGLFETGRTRFNSNAIHVSNNIRALEKMTSDGLKKYFKSYVRMHRGNNLIIEGKKRIGFSYDERELSLW